uniref:Threonine--tRNA ligase n=1 Tax=Anthurium amnicola TaxID=1678845 RepID=A0A1D1YW87_9ARAE
MADYEKEGEETSARGVDWEVVSLTASVYAAAPGPDGSDLADDSKDKGFNKNEEDYARALFMSGHFVFPPSEHEDLSLEPDNNEILNKFGVQDSDMIQDGADVPGKTQEEKWNNENLSEANDPNAFRFFEKGKRLPAHGVEFGDGTTTLQGLKLVEEGKSEYRDPGFGYFCTETDIAGSVLFDENSNIVESDDPLNQNSGFSMKPINQSKDNVSRIPCEAWWKKRAALLYAHAKEASTFWSLCVAAAVVGLVILGQRWQRERWQVQHLKYQLSINDKKFSRLLGPVTRFKGVVIGDHRHGPVLQGGSSSGC